MQTPGTTGVSAAAHVPKKGPHHISDSVSVSWVGDLEAGCVGRIPQPVHGQPHRNVQRGVPEAA